MFTVDHDSAVTLYEQLRSQIDRSCLHRAPDLRTGDDHSFEQDRWNDMHFDAVKPRQLRKQLGVAGTMGAESKIVADYKCARL